MGTALQLAGERSMRCGGAPLAIGIDKGGGASLCASFLAPSSLPVVLFAVHLRFLCRSLLRQSFIPPAIPPPGPPRLQAQCLRAQ